MEGKKPLIYVGSGKIVNGQYGPFRVVTLDLDEINKHSYVCKYTKKQRANVIVNDKKETDQFGKNVSVTINEFDPEEQGNKKQIIDDLPFET